MTESPVMTATQALQELTNHGFTIEEVYEQDTALGDAILDGTVSTNTLLAFITE